MKAVDDVAREPTAGATGLADTPIDDARWLPVCRFDRLERDRGVCALVGDVQVAIFRLSPSDEVYAVSNYDPFSRAFVLSRGIVGSKGDAPKVASPIYKQTFDLRTGKSFEDPSIRIACYPVRVKGGLVEVVVAAGAPSSPSLLATTGGGTRGGTSSSAQASSATGPADADHLAMQGERAPLLGWTIATLESRESQRLTALIQSKGATVLSYPMLRFCDPPDPSALRAWVGSLAKRELDIVILLTGEGVGRIVEEGRRLGIEKEVVAALGRAKTVTRGPKPARALRDLGILPAVPADVPTTDGVIESLRSRDLRGSTVGVQLYPRTSNGRLLQYLRSAGAEVVTVCPYVYESALDSAAVGDLVDRLTMGQIDVIAFTSRAQVERLFDVAGSLGLRKKLDLGLNRTRTAALGPVVASALRNRGHRVSIVPAKSFFMKSMVQEIVSLAKRTATPAA